jgi:hypothetical protein
VIDGPASGRERTVAGVLTGGALIFVGLGIPRLSSAGNASGLTLPLVLLGADLFIAAALLTGWYPIRPVGQGLAVFGVLVHTLVVLRSGPIWVRGCSVVLVVAHVAALVLMFLRTAAEADDEFDDDDDDDLDEPRPAFPPEPVLVEFPITEIIELERPVRDPAAEPTPEPLSDQEERTR